MVGHGADGRIGPDVFSGFNHVDDGVDRQDDTHDADGGTDAGHERQGQEVAAHGDAGITDGSQDGDEEPGNHGADREVKAAVLHEEQGRGAVVGSSLNTAYLLERLSQTLERLETLMAIFVSNRYLPRRILLLTGCFARAAAERHSISRLWKQSSGLMARSVTQNAA